MRDGRTGVELIRSVREKWCGGPEILATVLIGDTENDLAAVAQREHVGIVHKPISPGMLQDLLRALIPT